MGGGILGERSRGQEMIDDGKKKEEKTPWGDVGLIGKILSLGTRRLESRGPPHSRSIRV